MNAGWRFEFAASRHAARLVATATIVLATSGCSVQSGHDRAMKAFYAIDADALNGSVLRDADLAVGIARIQAKSDPWVEIAQSRLVLEHGYRSGVRSRMQSYRPEALRQALEHAQRAIALGPKESMAHVQLARLLIITGELQTAWEHLNQAHDLDPQGFYPWYYRAVIARLMEDPRRSSQALDEAEIRATRTYQLSWVAHARTDLAESTGDIAAEEAGHRREIELTPTDAYAYGNYAVFLKRERRFDEAVAYYRKAIALKPYGLAQEQLEQTLLQKDAATRGGPPATHPVEPLPELNPPTVDTRSTQRTVWGTIAQWTIWGVVMAIVMGWLARSRGRSARNAAPGTLQHPPGTLILSLVGTLFFATCTVMTLLVAGEPIPVLVPLTFLAFTLLSLAMVADFAFARHRVDQRGIHYGRMFGQRGFVTWAEVERVRYVPNMKWFRIQARNGKVIRVSTWLRGLPTFAQALLAGTDPKAIDAQTTAILRATSEGVLPRIWG